MELEQAIEDLICKVYCKKYNKDLRVKEIFKSDGSHLGYLLELDLNKSEKPFTIALDGTAEEFYCFVKKQLEFSQFHSIDYFEGTQCICNEECCQRR